MKRTLALFAFMLALFCAKAGACSICMYSVDGAAYFCGNEDWSAVDPAFRTYPAAKGGYGYLLLGWAGYLPSYAQAGVNSEGLCFDWAMVPTQKYARRPGKEELSDDFPVEALRRCKDVEEVIRLIGDRDFPHIAEEHLMFADRSSRSCVLEYGSAGIRVIRNSESYQFVTNFLLSNSSLGSYPCARYSRMEAFFKRGGDKTAELASLLDSVHQEGSYPTIYSYIFDLRRGRVSIFFNHNFKKKKDYELSELLKKASFSNIGP